MNQEFNMKKLTALLLGTVISVAFAADAFAGAAGNYWNSNDGKTGGYIDVSGTWGNIDDVQTPYTRRNGGTPADSIWALDSGRGARIAFGYDLGKIRFDWRFGALRSSVENIDSVALADGLSNDAVLGYSTFNIDLDLYRFELMKQNFVTLAVTPFIGAGYGYGGGWMTGRKNTPSPGVTHNDAGGHGVAFSAEAGILINLTDWAGITLGYNYLNQSFNSENVQSQLGSAGLRFTF